jgi:hypothetical protein
MQHDNTLNEMYFLILIDSIDLSGEDEKMDRADIARDYKKGVLRDGRGLRAFIESFVGQSDRNSQGQVVIRFLRAALAPGWGVGDLCDFMEVLRNDWMRLESVMRAGVESKASLSTYCERLLDALPFNPPSDLQTMVRHHLIGLMAHDSEVLKDPFKLREALSKHALLMGVPKPRARKGGGADRASSRS